MVPRNKGRDVCHKANLFVHHVCWNSFTIHRPDNGLGDASIGNAEGYMLGMHCWTAYYPAWIIRHFTHLPLMFKNKLTGSCLPHIVALLWSFVYDVDPATLSSCEQSVRCADAHVLAS